jgi:site-specific recombinase XerD
MTLTEKLDAVMRERSLLPATRSCYHTWVKHFYRSHGKPASQWSPEDVRVWMLGLHHKDYSPVSRKQALCAVKFVFDYVLRLELGHLDLPPMPRVHQTLRTIPTIEEIGRIFAGMHGLTKTMAQIMFGSGLRGQECCKLRVQDIDIVARTVRVWFGKGDKSRLTILPESMLPVMHRHLALRKALHDCDLANGCGLVELPGRLAMKYKNANREFRWQWLFPSTVVRGQYRWHATREAVAKQMRRAVRDAGIIKRVTPHTLRHAFVTYGLRCGNDIKTMMDLVGHEDANTTMIYAHADGAVGVSPMDVGMIQLPAARPLAGLLS